MALFLKGKYQGFYKAGSSQCVRDIFRFNKSAEDKVSLELTRRDMSTIAKKFWKIESSRFTLHPLDAEEPRQGGKVTVKSLVFDIRTFTIAMKTLYGIYGDDFIQYGTFKNDINPLEDEATLLQLTDSIENSDSVAEKITFKFIGDELFFSHEINQSLLDPDTNHQIDESHLLVSTKTSWSEKLFYGLGNQNM